MIHRRLLLIVPVVALATTPLVAAGPEPLTLTQAIREALAHNDRAIDSRDRIEQADLALHLARNEFRPKIVPNLQGSFGQSNVANQSYRVDLSQRLQSGTEVRLGAGASTAQIPSSIAGQPDIRYYNSDTTLSVSQPLLRGAGSAVIGRAMSIATLERGDAGRALQRTEQDLTVEVAAAYYHLVAAQALQQVAANSLERARQLVAASRARQEAGIVSQLDVLRAQELASQAELQASDVEATLDDAKDRLNLLMGREADSPLTVVSEIPAAATGGMSATEAVAVALEKRTDLRSLIASAADSRRAIGVASNELLPQLDVNLLLTRRDTARSLFDSFRVGTFQFATFVTVSMPVDRTPAIVSYQNALIERDRRDRAVESLRRSITDEVMRAVRERDRVRRNLAVATTAVEIAKQEIDVAEFRYQRGLSNNLDLVGAEGNLLAAEGRRIAAQADAAVADLRFRALIGTLDPRHDPLP